MAIKKENLIEICRSCSEKVSKPNNRYENVDFFCSVKREVPLEEFEQTSKDLSAKAIQEVARSVAEYKAGFDREVTYEPITPATPEEEEAVQRKIEEVQAKLITNEDKAKLQEAENI